MSYIGNPIVSTDFPKDTFSGNGSTTAFTMAVAPASVNSVIVVVSGITQDPSTYTISGTTLTFSAAPPTGTSNISVRHLGVAGIPNVPALASVVPASINSGYSLWNLSGSDVNYTAGKVGVGSASPRVRLDLRSDAVIAAPTPLANAVTSGVFAVGDSVGSVMGLQLNGSSYDTYIQARNMGAASTAYNLLLQPLGGIVKVGGDLQFNSGYGSVATAYGCRAWVNFNGTGTVAIRASGNVSSITDNGTGDYTVNFTTSMPDNNYSVGAQSARTDSNTTNSYYAFLEARSTLSEIVNVNYCRFLTGSAHTNGASAVRYDAGLVTVQIFR